MAEKCIFVKIMKKENFELYSYTYANKYQEQTQVDSDKPESCGWVVVGWGFKILVTSPELGLSIIALVPKNACPVHTPPTLPQYWLSFRVPL